MLIENGQKITDKKLIANILNAHQVNVSHNVGINRSLDILSVKNYHNMQQPIITNPFSSSDCSEDEIKLIITNLKNSNAADFYGMSNNFIKTHSDQLIPSITNLINFHMNAGEFPDCLKVAVVSSIFKNKGSKLDKKNYRPISILPILSKIFESVLYRRIYTHCHDNKFFNDDQFGYQEKSGTEACMIHTLNDIYTSLDRKLSTALVTIDLSNAFDCLNHDILILKLSKLQFPKKFMNMIMSYFHNRRQFVKIDDTLSNVLELYCGAPQGGVLSGLFFNIYVNSIFNLRLNNTLRLYCDDMSLIASGENRDVLKENIKHDLIEINNWLELHFLKANFSKTSYIIFNGRKKFEAFTDRSLNIEISNSKIERVDHIKIVGLIIDEQLNFSFHIENIKNKIIPFIAKLFQIRRFLSEEVALKLYFAHVYSHLIYMNSIWSVAPKYLIESLSVIQRRALRAVFRKDRLSHNIELFNEKILPLTSVIQLHQNLLVFKMTHGLLKNNIQLISVHETHRYGTRANKNIVCSSATTALAHNNFYYRAIKSYNELPSNIKRIDAISRFKKRLKEFLSDSIIDEFPM